MIKANSNSSKAFIESLHLPQKKSLQSQGQLFLVWLIFLLVYVVGTVAVNGLREGFFVKLHTDILYTIELLLCIFTIVYSGFIAFELGIPKPSYNKLHFISPFATMLAFFAVFALNESLSPQMINFGLVPMHWQITVRVCMYTLIPIAVTMVLVKRLAPTRLAWNSAFIFLSAAVLGHFIVRVVMVPKDVNIVLMFCFLPAIIITFIGAIFFSRLLRW